MKIEIILIKFLLFIQFSSLAVQFNMTWAADLANNASDGMSVVSESDINQELIAAPEEVRRLSLTTKERLASLIEPVLTDKRIEVVARKEGFQNKPEVEAAIERSTRNTIVKMYFQEKMDEAAAKIGDLEPLAKEKYLANKSNYLVPESYKVAHILLRYDPETSTLTESEVKQHADKVLQELKVGADFSKMAKNVSEDPVSAKLGGELPDWVVKDTLVPPFAKAISKLKPGEMSGVVRTRFGFHIIKLIDHKDAYTRLFAEVKTVLIHDIKEQLISQSREEFLSKYRATKYLEIPDALFDSLRENHKVSEPHARP